MSTDLALAITESTEKAERRTVALKGTQVAVEKPIGATQEAQAIETAPAVVEQVAAEEPEGQPKVHQEATQVQEIKPTTAEETTRQQVEAKRMEEQTVIPTRPTATEQAQPTVDKGKHVDKGKAVARGSKGPTPVQSIERVFSKLRLPSGDGTS